VNAVKFSPEGERVIVEVTLEDGDVICTVTDFGPGIPDTFRERLFQKFAQVDSSDTRNTSGTGLGLAISKQLAINMNGLVGYETATGGGAQFWVRFPVVATVSEDL
jgi:signal transduction histidine kinase